MSEEVAKGESVSCSFPWKTLHQRIDNRKNSNFLCMFSFQCQSKNNGLKEMHTLAIQRFYLPGESSFPLNALYARPGNRQEEGEGKKKNKELLRVF